MKPEDASTSLDFWHDEELLHVSFCTAQALFLLQYPWSWLALVTGECPPAADKGDGSRPDMGAGAPPDALPVAGRQPAQQAVTPLWPC